MEKYPLRRIRIDDIPEPSARLFDPEIDAVAKQAIDAIRTGKEEELRRWAERLDGLPAGAPLVISCDEMKAAYDALPKETAELLGRAKGRVAAFAAAQRACLAPLSIPLQIEPIEIASPIDPIEPKSLLEPNEPADIEMSANKMVARGIKKEGEKGALCGRYGHEIVPVARVGCYVPGGAFPLPSSAIMTVVPAKVAGVEEVWCAGPNPSKETLAASWLAGAEGFLQVGGAHAIAALAFGVCIPKCDVIVGPGGKYVASAKRQLFGIVGTEAPAGPSELLIIADKTAEADIIAADLLAQAEHSPDSLPAAIVTEETLALEIQKALKTRLEELPEPNRSIANRALSNGFICVEHDLLRVVDGANRCAPEHLEIATTDPASLMKQIKNAGAVFLGLRSAEVFGDYGAGPNHTLPTGGASRFAAGLSVLCFLRTRTWLAIENPELLVEDTAAFARLEGLEAHAQAALARTLKHKNESPKS